MILLYLEIKLRHEMEGRKMNKFDVNKFYKEKNTKIKRKEKNYATKKKKRIKKERNIKILIIYLLTL